MLHRDKIALQKILNAIYEAIEILSDTSKEEFLNSNTFKLAMGVSIIRVGELVKTLTSDFRQKNSQVPWRDITGFRDVAAHKYEIIDMEELYDTIQEDFPELKLQIEKILEADEK